MVGGTGLVGDSDQPPCGVWDGGAVAQLRAPGRLRRRGAVAAQLSRCEPALSSGCQIAAIHQSTNTLGPQLPSWPLLGATLLPPPCWRLPNAPNLLPLGLPTVCDRSQHQTHRWRFEALGPSRRRAASQPAAALADQGQIQRKEGRRSARSLPTTPGRRRQRRRRQCQTAWARWPSRTMASSRSRACAASTQAHTLCSVAAASP